MPSKIVKFDASLNYLLLELTTLLREAYSALTSAGMISTASQSIDTTLQRLKSGESFLAFLGDEVVGIITVDKGPGSDGIEWFSSPKVFHFTQFAVSPRFQGKGIGRELLEHAESYAKKECADELALDTSENATGLVNWYSKRGYRLVGHTNLFGVAYRSVILSKSLRADQ